MMRLAEERDEIKVDAFRMAPTGTRPTRGEHAHLAPHERVRPLSHELPGRDHLVRVRAKPSCERVGSTTRVIPVPNDFYPTTFRRPENTYLINAALQARGLDQMPQWEEALADYLEARGVPVAASGGSR